MTLALTPPLTTLTARPAPPDPPAGYAARLNQVSLAYPGAAAPVLDAVDLTVSHGELLCLLGPSGSGKSTLLRVLAGLEQAAEGQVRVPGRPAVMFQDHALMPWLTAGENVELALKFGRVARSVRRARAEELLHAVRLKGVYGKRVHELSGGMRQCVALACALAQDSELLLLDEPFAALDAVTREALHEELLRVRRERNLSVVFVTHDVREAARLGDRLVQLSAGSGRIARQWRPGSSAGGSEALVRSVMAQLHTEVNHDGTR